MLSMLLRCDMFERPREEQLVHFFATEVRRLVCGFVGTRINWTVDARAVDCPKCQQQLMGGAGEPEGRASSTLQA
jgi:hypothetical protein